MFIIEKPYASQFFLDTITKNDWPVLYNSTVAEAEFESGAFNLINTENAVKYYSLQEFPLIYTNSENAISWILENLPRSNTAEYINAFKDKIKFREMLKELYPNFYFKSISYEELKTINTKEIKFPVVLKPAVGFLSFGVHAVKDETEWKAAIDSIDKDMKTACELYPSNVINNSNFLIEEMISGEEYAVDAYFDRNGEPVILNIFQHPFLNYKDVSDRIYLMSPGIMIKYMAKIMVLLCNIGEIKNIRNFPLHLEIRVTKDGEIIPIEINPMRFAGWCTADVAKYAWGINVYECFYHQIKPNWNEILINAKKEVFYFSMAEIPSNIERGKILNFDYKKFLANYSNILELRQINFKTHPLFAIIFGSTFQKEEIVKILSLNTKDFIIQ